MASTTLLAATTATGGPTASQLLPGASAWSIAEVSNAHAIRTSGPRSLSAQAVIRAAVFIQSAFRRWAVEECRQLADIQPVEPPPPVTVGLYLSRQLRKARSPAEVEAEAMTVAAVMCGRERGLLLGPLARTCSEYQSLLPAGHPALMLLRERFHEVAVDAEEDLYARTKDASIPSEVRSRVLACRQTWDLPPSILPEGWADPFAPSEAAAVERLAPGVEASLEARLPGCDTARAFGVLEEDIERELVNRPCPLRANLRRARQGYLDNVLLIVQTEFGWAPQGLPKLMASAGRWYVHELGRGQPRLEDFLAAAQRAIRRAEAAAAAELAPHEAHLDRLRGLVFADPPPPKLILNGYKEELEEREAEAFAALAEIREQLGTESSDLFAHSRRVLGKQRFVAAIEAEAAEAAHELTDMGPCLPSESALQAQARLAAASRLEQLLAVLRAEHAGIQTVDVGQHVAEETRRILHLVDLYGDLAREADAGEQALSDWHQPPGFDIVEQVLQEPARPLSAEEPELDFTLGEVPAPPPEKPPPPAGAEPISCRMMLHGVSMQDATCKSEILFLEKAAEIIAKECKIPQEWITAISLDVGAR